MTTFLNMSPLGWLAALAAGFVVGGLYFLSIKLQVEYVARKRGAEWLMPAALYARLILVAVILILVAVVLPGRRVPAAMIAGAAGSFIARVLVSRWVRRGG